MKTRACKVCGEVKPLTAEFFGVTGNNHTLRHKCKQCVYSQTAALRKAQRAADPEGYAERMASYQRKHVYGVTPSLHADLKSIQEGRCMICDKEVPLVIDHDHETEKVRGLLCKSCNFGLGCFFDDPVALQRAAAYLTFHRLSREQDRVTLADIRGAMG